MLNKLIGKVFLGCYKLWVRITCKLFSLMISGGFARFGTRSVLQYSLRLFGEDRIEIGDEVFIGANSWLQTLPDGGNTTTALYVGSGTSIEGNCVISAVRCVIIEDHVLLARNVYISDHTHNYDDRDRPILSQKVGKVAPVLIRRGAWLGQNVVVCSGVTIGRGSVIGANSVVKSDVPDWCVAAGAPARVVRVIGAPPLFFS